MLVSSPKRSRGEGFIDVPESIIKKKLLKVPNSARNYLRNVF